MEKHVSSLFQRIISMILCVVMMTTVLPAPVAAAQITDGVIETGGSAAENEGTITETEDTVLEESAPEWILPECDCGSTETELGKHGETCALKVFLEEFCDETAAEIFSKWDKLPEECQAYVLEFLGEDEANEEKLAELNGYVSAAADDSQLAADETVPTEDETVPAEDETDPAEDEIVPTEDETVPAEDETDPAEDEIVPTEEETEEAPEIGLMATSTGEKTVYVIAGSDYQGHESDDNEANTGTARGVVTTKILNELASCGIKPDGALFCGDYTRYGRSSNIANNKSDVKRGIDQLKSLTTSTLGVKESNVHWIFAQGNHDVYATTEHGLSKGGANDPASGAYGVYVLNNNDYGWTTDGNMAGNTELIEKERQEMKAYFDAKIKAGYTKPIFIAAHIPLHYSYRTRTYEDARYARMIFNVINDAGAKGLNIIYLFGHNHSAPSDSYIGGGAAYLGRGDTIFIAKTDNVDAKPSKLTLNFTYMNCGYLSYASNVNTDGSTPSMAVFAITGDKVEIKRYCYHGLLALKARGKLASFAESSGTVTETHDTYGVTEAEMNAYLNTRFKSTTLEPVSSTNMGETIQIPIFSTRFYQVNTFKEGQFFAIANYGDGEGQYQVLRTTNDSGGVGVRNVTFKKDSSGRIYFEPFATDDENKAIQWIWEGYAQSENGTVGSLKNRLYSRYLQMTDDGSGFVLGAGSKGLRTTSSKNTEDLKMYWGYDNKTRTAGDFKGYPSGVYAHSDNELTVVANRYYVLRNGKSNGWSAGGSGSPSGGNGPTYIFKRFTDYISGYDKAVAEGPTEYTLVTGQYASWDKLKTKIMSDLTVKVNGKATTGYTLSSTADPTTAGEYIAYVNYNGYTLGTIKIHVTKAQIVSAVVSPDSGEVFQHSGSNTKTGSILTVTYDNGAVVEVPVTVGMLKTSDGQAVSTGTTGRKTNLSIVYDGFTVSGYTLVVRNKNHPGYPNPGSVKVEKEGEGVEFAKTGAANVELSATGMPMVRGIDVIVMVDTSSSMSAGKTEDGITRDQATYNAINELIKTLKADIKAGVLGDTTKIAIADFNGYKTPKDGKTYATKGWGGYYALDEDAWVRDPDNPLNSKLHYDKVGYMNVANSHGARTGTGGVNNLTASAFVDVRDLSDTWANSERLPLHGGTNYDFAMDAIYQLGYSIKEYNELKDRGERELVVIFLSDGCPFQYNYWMSHANNNLWNFWLQGELNESALNHLTGLDKTFQHFYNSDGKHWMAEAIKGDPGKTYKVIRKSDEGLEGVIQKLKTSAGGEQYMGYLPGLGAQVHTIALGIVGNDGNIWHSSMVHVLKNISSDATNNYHNVNNAEELKGTFQQIATTIVQAATQSYFLDTMGEEYDLYMSDKILKSDGTVLEGVVPAIEVRDYAVSGILRSTEPEKVLERITFGGDYRNVADGTSMTVYQDLLNEDGTYTRKTISMKMGDLLKGKYVYYNTSKTKSQTITYYGKTITLEPETFFYITTTLVKEKEFALNYYVYLEDALDNNGDNIAVDAGTYNTNKSAKLYYKNYLGKDCTKDTVSPKFSWENAKVNYGFYLVDPEGKIISDETSGTTTTDFSERTEVIASTLFEEFQFNTTSSDIMSHELAKELIEELAEQGYELYVYNGETGKGVTYSVKANSGNGGGSWSIEGDSTGTTYVTGYNGEAYSNSTEGQDPGNYSNTTVWFAVVSMIDCVPDTVVVDFGLPVKIDVTANDKLIGTNGKLAGIGLSENRPDNSRPKNGSNQSLQDGFGAALNEGLNYGSAKIEDDNVVYSLETMEMNDAEVFYYAMEYAGKTGAKGYYYSTVTVIPATTIYYEDSFVTFSVYDFGTDKKVTDFSDSSKHSNNQWTSISNADSKNQAQDRPGEYSFPEVDANNIYGYDGAYTNMTTYSLGSAMKVTVDNDAYATAEFDFWGTGFDIISLTSGDTGVIMAKVYDKTAYDAYLANPTTAKKPASLKSLMVDTYYGYKYVGGKWVVDSSSTDALYQVPVLKVELTDTNGNPMYGNYTAIITASYADFLDNRDPGDGTGTYDFYLDAIRIYDPANDGANSKVIKDAYVADGEGWPEYFELRNLIISKNDFDSLKDGTGKGIVFIDNTLDSNKNLTYTISDYTNFGPNNELYLAPGQAVAFDLAVNHTDLDQIHLAMKTVGGSGTSQVKVYDATKAAENVSAQNISTATDLYYNITSLNNKTVVIQNTSTSGAILSITNVKVTYTAEHQDGIENSFFTVNPNTGADALYSLMRRPDDVPEEEIPETTVPETTVPEPSKPKDPSNPFVDVEEEDFFYESVIWAAESGITAGYGAEDIFAPDRYCTRSQVVTFLWRAAGEPEPATKTNPFKDIKKTDYFYKAVLWAVEQDITKGYGTEDIFNPEGSCTRAQVATFLHRYYETPAAKNGKNPFTDITKNAFYYDAVLWAVEEGITNGYGSSSIFNPDGECTRGEIVTFLYRAMN